MGNQQINRAVHKTENALVWKTKQYFGHPATFEWNNSLGKFSSIKNLENENIAQGRGTFLVNIHYS